MGNRLLGNYIRNGNLYLIAGITGVGKTALINNLAEEFSSIFNEKKILLCYSKVHERKGYTTNDQIHICELTDLISTSHILIEAKCLYEECGLSTILIDDYRVLLREKLLTSVELSKREKLILILTRLKDLAEIYDVPIVMTGGVDDDYIYGRHDKNLMLDDIPDYEVITVIVDGIILLNRDELFYEGTENKGVANCKIIDITTNQNCDYMLTYLPEYKRFCVRDSLIN